MFFREYNQQDPIFCTPLICKGAKKIPVKPISFSGITFLELVGTHLVMTDRKVFSQKFRLVKKPFLHTPPRIMVCFLKKWEANLQYNVFP